MSDDLDAGGHAGEDDAQGPDALEPAPTPGERLLYALGQLYRLHRHGQLPVAPAAFDIEDLARIIGVWPEVELVVEDGRERRYHFVGEVLSVNAGMEFPWRLLDTQEFAAEHERGSRPEERGRCAPAAQTCSSPPTWR